MALLRTGCPIVLTCVAKVICVCSIKTTCIKICLLYQKPSSTVFHRCDIIIWTDLHNKTLQYYQHVITTIESIMCLCGNGLNLVWVQSEQSDLASNANVKLSSS